MSSTVPIEDLAEVVKSGAAAELLACEDYPATKGGEGANCVLLLLILCGLQFTIAASACGRVHERAKCLNLIIPVNDTSDTTQSAFIHPISASQYLWQEQ